MDVGRYIFSPGRKLCGFLIEARSEHGVFRKILNVAAGHGARLKLAHFQSLKEEKRIIVFFDCTECDVEPQELMDEISGSRSVISIKPIESQIEGFLADTVSHPLQIAGARAIILRKPLYEGLIRGVRERFGSGGEAFLYHIGYEIGRKASAAHREVALKLGIADLERIFKQVGGCIFQCVGFGIPQIIKFQSRPLQITIRVYSLFECELGRGTGKPYSYLVRGMLTGVTTELFNTPTTVTETKCIAKGDPYCEFTIKPT